MPDIFQHIDALDATAQQRVIDRLEFRGNYAPFVAMRDAYLDMLDLPPGARVCELGCGTGVVSRAIAARDSFDGTVIGSDLSEALVAAANWRARFRAACDRGQFFGSCNFVTYVAKPN